jgi:hypothetical protein
MSLEAFVARKFSEDSQITIEKANEIIAEYQRQGFTLTLRQLYYQFVSRDLIKNKQTEYKRLGSIINDARLAGLIDWDAIEDRTRRLRTQPSWSSPSSIVEACASQYQEDLWATQKHRPQVWIEKDALIGVIEPVCERLRLPYFACRGYSSQSEQYKAGKLFAKQRKEGKTPIVFHLGDHDPSGIDMTRDNADRLSMFARAGVEVRRLALNFDQVEQYDPPPNPAKETDSRAPGYIERFGDSSWELDALEPTVIDQIIETAVRPLINQDRWEVAENREAQNKARLEAVSENWEDIVNNLPDDPI